MTIDLPRPLLRRAKATAAVRGTSLKSLVLAAIERETQSSAPPEPATQLPFRFIHLKHKKVLNLSGFDFDDLLP